MPSAVCRVFRGHPAILALAVVVWGLDLEALETRERTGKAKLRPLFCWT